uniref:Cytochrome c oxidase subunit 2 n=1 Tax=Myzostoma seymourcollegiorum TaxID=447489 RepID=A6MVL3_MYZSE|nr:cytochrome c oxidase subunit II [Myzostoma seymourcollegiorum]
MQLWNQISFQDSASPIMSQLILFHDHCMFIVILISTILLVLFFMLMTNKFHTKILSNISLIESIWTILPALTLMLLSIPSLRLLYLMEESSFNTLTLKIMGHQWYWSCEYADFNNIEFDSYMLPSDDINNGMYRLLNVDNSVPLPLNSNIRLLVSAADVIHSWTIPSLGVKFDAVPGRLNQSMMYLNRPGIFYGQCSEICGSNHSFMPITLEILWPNDFITWIKSKI